MRLVGRKIVAILIRLTLKNRVMEILDNRSAADGDVRDARQQPVAPVMSVGEWMLTLLILALPLVNIIMLFVWAFESDESQLLQSVADLDRDRYRALCVFLLVDYGIVRSDPVADGRQARKTVCFRGLVGRGRGYERA